MGVVHGLEGDAGVIAVEVAVLDEIFDGVDDLFVALVCGLVFEGGCCMHTFFSRLACSRRASNTAQMLADAWSFSTSIAYSCLFVLGVSSRWKEFVLIYELCAQSRCGVCVCEEREAGGAVCETSLAK